MNLPDASGSLRCRHRYSEHRFPHREQTTQLSVIIRLLALKNPRPPTRPALCLVAVPSGSDVTATSVGRFASPASGVAGERGGGGYLRTVTALRARIAMMASFFNENSCFRPKL